MTSWLSAFSPPFRAVALTEFTLVSASLRACYFFCTLRTDVMMHNRAAEVSLTAVRGGFDRFLMKPWMACQNPSWYKNCAALVQAKNQTREIPPLYPHALVIPPCGNSGGIFPCLVCRLHERCAIFVT